MSKFVGRLLVKFIYAFLLRAVVQPFWRRINMLTKLHRRWRWQINARVASSRRCIGLLEFHSRGYRYGTLSIVCSASVCRTQFTRGAAESTLGRTTSKRNKQGQLNEVVCDIAWRTVWLATRNRIPPPRKTIPRMVCAYKKYPGDEMNYPGDMKWPFPSSTEYPHIF